MSDIILVPPGACARAQRLRRRFAAQGREMTLIPLVRDIRELELSRDPLHLQLRPQLGALHQTIRQMAVTSGQCLPEALAVSVGGRLPSWWETYRDAFARAYIAPSYLCSQIAALAVAEYHPSAAWLVPSPELPHRAHLDLAMSVGLTLNAAGVTLRVAGRGGISQVPGHNWLAGAKRLAQIAGQRRRRQAPVGPADVCCLAIGATSAPIIARLARTLQAEHGLSALAADLNFGGSTEALARYGLPGVDPLALAPAEAWREAVRRQLALALNGPLIAARAWRVTGEAQALTMQMRLAAALARSAAVGVYRIHCAESLLELVRPRALLAFHPYADIVAPYILAAKRRGIPCLYLQHGILGPYSRALGWLPYDKLMVFGDYVRGLLEGWADDDAPVVVTGHCLYDSVERDTPVDEELRGRLLGGRARLALVTTQPDEPQVKAMQDQWWLEGVAEACARLDTRMVLKLHPQEPGAAAYDGLAAAYPECVTVLAHGVEPLERLIDAADVVVMRDSTVAYEANLRGRPVVTVNLSGQDDRFPIAEGGGALGVHVYAQILPALERVLTNQGARAEMAAGREPFLRAHLGPLDGEATRRVCAQIAGML